MRLRRFSLPTQGAYRGCLARYQDSPCSAVLLTGTGIVPGDDSTLADGDAVSIEIESIGILHKMVIQMKE